MITRHRVVGMMLGVLTASGCTDAVPTSQDSSLIPVEALTVEVRLPFDAFATDFRTFSGFGTPSWLPGGIVANQWGGDLDSHILAQFIERPASISVIPTGSVNPVADSSYTVSHGRLIFLMDTIQVRGDPPFQFELEAIQSEWDVRSATWEMAVDTVGGQLSWPEPGGGPVIPLGSATWTPTTDGDSMVFEVDGPIAQGWTDPDRSRQGLRIRSVSEGTRLRITAVDLDLWASSELNPDTLVEAFTGADRMTSVYTPDPDPGTESFLVGGAPAWRATFRMELPEQLQGTPELCAQVSCPWDLLPERLVYAGLELRTHATQPAGLQPIDSLEVDVWTTLAPERLPRSPLGQPVQQSPRRVAPDAFSSELGTRVEIPMTRYVREILFGRSAGQDLVSPVLSVLSAFEPTPMEFGTFGAPGTEHEPTLRLIFTTSEGEFLP